MESRKESCGLAKDGKKEENRHNTNSLRASCPPNGTCAKRCARWQLFVTFDSDPAATCLSGRRTMRQARKSHGWLPASIISAREPRRDAPCRGFVFRHANPVAAASTPAKGFMCASLIWNLICSSVGPSIK